MHANVIKHFWKSNRELIISKSLKDCHCVGVDSILFDDTPEARIRMFVARENHELWENHQSSQEFSISFHPHHCDLTIERIYGNVQNLYGFPAEPKYYGQLPPIEIGGLFGSA